MCKTNKGNQIKITMCPEDGPEVELNGGYYPLSAGDVVVNVNGFSQVIPEFALRPLRKFLSSEEMKWLDDES